jgi:4-amino-4-deoxy-L-arabinose transferase-like glycosyltransferase
MVAVLLRLISAVLQGDQIEALPGIQDQFSYDALAQRVLAGHGFTFGVDWWPATRADEPTAHWSFLYTAYLTAVYAVFGVHPLAARLIQACAAGIVYPWLTWRLGRRLLGSQIGLIGAALTAVYGYFVYYAGALMTETFYIAAVLWALDLATVLTTPRNLRSAKMQAGLWLLLGLALSLAVLLRQLVLIFVPVLFAWLIWVFARQRRDGPGDGGSFWRPDRRLVAGALLSGFVLVASIAPWTIRNYEAFGRFVLLNTNSGYAFFWANHPIHGTDFVPIFPSQVYHDLIPQELRPLDEAALDSALMSRGVQFVLDDPVRYALLSLSRIKTYFEFWPSAESSEPSNVARVLSFGLYGPLMLAGTMVWFVQTRKRKVSSWRWRHVTLLYLFGAVYTLIHLLSWALVRYRLPLDAVMMPIAALAVLQLAVAVRARTQSTTKSPPIPAGTPWN